MEEKTDKRKKNEKKRSGLPTHMGLIFRIVAGGYLVYLAYSIYSGSGEVQGAEKIAFVAAIALFSVIGLWVIVSSLRAMQRGEYEGGVGDPRKDAGKTVKTQEEEKTGRIRFGEPETIPREKEDQHET